MNLKSKIVSGIAALGLSVSMIAGAAAADPVSVPGTVILGPGNCAYGFSESGQELDFGSWVWNGPLNAYQPESATSNIATVSGTLYFPTNAGGTCNVHYGELNLYLDGDTDTEPLSDFEVSIDGGVGYGALPVGTGNFDANVASVSGEMFVKLVSVPTDFVVGTYTGSMQITVSNEIP